MAKLESMDEKERQSYDSHDKSRAELIAVKAELDRQRARHKEDHEMLNQENDELNNKIKQLKDDIVSFLSNIVCYVYRDNYCLGVSSLCVLYNELYKKKTIFHLHNAL